MIFAFAGDITVEAAQNAVERHFPKLPRRSLPPPAAGTPPPRRGLELLLVDKPERTQSQILFGHPTIAWKHPDFFRLLVGTTAFGGTFTARLMNEVRSKRGLSYGASARVGQGRAEKALVLHVFPSLEQTPETVELVLRLTREWVRDGLTEDEVKFSQSYLANNFAFQLATPEDRLDLDLALELTGVDADYAKRYVHNIRATTRKEINHALTEHVHPADLAITLVSTAEQMLPLLEKTNFGEARPRIQTTDYLSY
jgi:zinc protease